MKNLDFHRLILNAALGSSRKDAQIDTCTVFSAALYDVLRAARLRPEVYDATLYQVTTYGKGGSQTNTKTLFVHSVLRIRGKYYDSLGLFNEEIVRGRMKVHKNVQSRLDFQKSVRDYDEMDYSELHAFLRKALQKQLSIELDR
ncbi:hypothetical protein AA14337_3085 [Acetobacter malorum DSM 14337]|uniref:Uncharacterized protein n=1 Tax=Acetobacter malorum DSM 14337 TaxID=1307910 RepID=A0ABQ0PZJ5_9PROT|nr:hypothetical protein [Acetobacter malorum]KXV05671.1 hypothetical protein AD930_11080 [Acetobacter malorum]GBQ85493.1 hypothetical protein AA14337_3085 [Acetobacter malorum DSM 14337]